ncbi:MAG TPA: hypothetical protein VGH51_09805 [Candidatus Angelobacter sp.]|jgi:type VI protein secretion system component VasK
MGFAFSCPSGIGSLIAGWFCGRLIHHFGDVTHQPEKMRWAMIGVGVLTALLLWIYDRTLMPKEATAKISQAAKSNAQKACQLPIFALGGSSLI